MIISGVGRHIYCLPLGSIADALQWSIYAQIVNILGIGLVKVSVCLCILRVIDKVGKALSRFLYLMIAFVSVSHFAQVGETLMMHFGIPLAVLKYQRYCSSSYSAGLWRRYGIHTYAVNASLPM